MLAQGRYATPNALSAWFVTNVDRDAGSVMTHLKVQKLAYYADAWFMVHFDRPLIKEPFQAWAHGPVCRTIYDKYKNSSWQALEPENVPTTIRPVVPFLENVLESYGKYSAKQLEKMTHAEDPWKNARGSLPPEARCETPLDKLFVRNYYAKRIGKEEIQKLSD